VNFFSRHRNRNRVTSETVWVDGRGFTGGRSIDIYFFCGSCGQRMVIDEAGVGLVIPCPKCAKDVTVPESNQPTPTPPPATTSQPEKERTVALKWVPPPSGATK